MFFIKAMAVVKYRRGEERAFYMLTFDKLQLCKGRVCAGADAVLLFYSLARNIYAWMIVLYMRFERDGR